MAETDKERVDRELIELLNEVRIVLPGVQVLFAFLLILPFQQGFRDISELDRAVYFAALLLSAGASALVMAPAAYHRLNFRRQHKERMLFTSNRLLISGMLLMVLGIACAIFLIANVLFGDMPATLVAIVSGMFFVGLWFGLPLLRRRGNPEVSSRASDPPLISDPDA